MIAVIILAAALVCDPSYYVHPHAEVLYLPNLVGCIVKDHHIECPSEKPGKPVYCHEGDGTWVRMDR